MGVLTSEEVEIVFLRGDHVVRLELGLLEDRQRVLEEDDVDVYGEDGESDLERLPHHRRLRVQLLVVAVGPPGRVGVSFRQVLHQERTVGQENKAHGELRRRVVGV